MSASKKHTSGSQKRVRRRSIQVFLTEEEYAAVMQQVDASGLSKSSYGRKALRGRAGERAQRRPSVDRVLLAHAIAELNKVGSNLNQIARVLNTYGVNDMTGMEVMAAVAETRAAVARMMALTERKGEG